MSKKIMLITLLYAVFSASCLDVSASSTYGSFKDRVVLFVGDVCVDTVRYGLICRSVQREDYVYGVFLSMPRDSVILMEEIRQSGYSWIDYSTFKTECFSHDCECSYDGLSQVCVYLELQLKRNVPIKKYLISKKLSELIENPLREFVIDCHYDICGFSDEEPLIGWNIGEKHERLGAFSIITTSVSYQIEDIPALVKKGLKRVLSFQAPLIVAKTYEKKCDSKGTEDLISKIEADDNVRTVYCSQTNGEMVIVVTFWASLGFSAINRINVCDMLNVSESQCSQVSFLRKSPKTSFTGKLL